MTQSPVVAVGRENSVPPKDYRLILCRSNQGPIAACASDHGHQCLWNQRDWSSWCGYGSITPLIAIMSARH